LWKGSSKHFYHWETLPPVEMKSNYLLCWLIISVGLKEKL
jgi:hypothetical protein